MAANTNSDCHGWLTQTIDPNYPVVFLDTDALGVLMRPTAYVIVPGPVISCISSENSVGEIKTAHVHDCSTVALERRTRALIVNESEAVVLGVVVSGLVRLGLSPDRIAVIAPYRSQFKVLDTI